MADECWSYGVTSSVDSDGYFADVTARTTGIITTGIGRDHSSTLV